MQLLSQWLINILKVLPFRFQQCVDPFQCCLSKGPLKHGFLDIYITTFFRGSSSGNTSAVRISFFEKCLKFNRDFKNAKKNRKKDFCFWYNCMWIVYIKLSLVSRKCFTSAVNVLRNILKILCITKRDIFKCNYLHGD